jgi:hypothetical protein
MGQEQMTNEERFQRIESDLAAAAHTLKETTEALGVLAQAIGRYADESNLRMKRMEENLRRGSSALSPSRTRTGRRRNDERCFRYMEARCWVRDGAARRAVLAGAGWAPVQPEYCSFWRVCELEFGGTVNG